MYLYTTSVDMHYITRDVYWARISTWEMCFTVITEEKQETFLWNIEFVIIITTIFDPAIGTSIFDQQPQSVA